MKSLKSNSISQPKLSLSKMLENVCFAPVVTGFTKQQFSKTENVCNTLDNSGNLWIIAASDESISTIAIEGRTNFLFADSSTDDMNMISIYGSAEVTSEVPSTIFAGNKKYKNWMANHIGKRLMAYKVEMDEVCFWNNNTFAYETLFKNDTSTIRVLEQSNVDQVAMSA